MVVLGGSVTSRMAGCTHDLTPEPGAPADAPQACGLLHTHDANDAGQGWAQRGAGWARMFVDYLQDTHPPSGNRSHVLFNGGVAASGNDPEPFLMCWCALPRLAGGPDPPAAAALQPGCATRQPGNPATRLRAGWTACRITSTSRSWSSTLSSRTPAARRRSRTWSTSCAAC